MNTVIRKIGNSEGVIIPKEVLERLNLKAGDKISIEESGLELRLRPISSDQELNDRMNVARERMKKYAVAYRALAK